MIGLVCETSVKLFLSATSLSTTTARGGALGAGGETAFANLTATGLRRGTLDGRCACRSHGGGITGIGLTHRESPFLAPFVSRQQDVATLGGRWNVVEASRSPGRRDGDCADTSRGEFEIADTASVDRSRVDV